MKEGLESFSERESGAFEVNNGCKHSKDPKL